MPVSNNFIESTGLTGSPMKHATSRIAKSAVINPVWTVKRIIFAYKIRKEHVGVDRRDNLLYLSYRQLEKGLISA
jgi:hypothetical protein